MNKGAVLQKLSRPQLWVVGGGVTLLVLGIFFAWLLLPAFKFYLETKRESRTLSEFVQSAEPRGVSSIEEQKQIEALNQELEPKQLGAENKEIQTEMMNRLQQLAWQHALVLVSVKPMPTQTVGPFQEYVLMVELLGQYFDLFHWLKDVEKTWPAVVMKHYSVERFDRGPSVKEPRLSAKMELAFYEAKKI